MRVRGARSLARLFATYAVISMIPVLVLGSVLALSYRSEALRRGLAEGRSEALVLEESAVEPLLSGRTLSDGLAPSQSAELDRMAHTLVANGDILRLRLRDQAGRVVFSPDGSGLGLGPDDEAVAASRGQVVTRYTHLNADGSEGGSLGVQAIEVYAPLRAGAAHRQVGVFEIYLPYAPIRADVATGLHSLYRALAIGLALLFVALFLISLSVSRGLRREVRLNVYLAEHDALTGLPNRALFLRRAGAALHRGRRRQTRTAIAIVDLDRFKEVNDTLGHHNGDLLLTELAQRLTAWARAGDVVARLGGDEFGIVLRDVVEPEEALTHLRARIEEVATINGLPLTVESSIGYVIAPDDGTEVDELLQRADVAMYMAKSHHTGVLRYQSRDNHYDAGKLALVAELRQALEANELVLHYQPKAVVADGHVEAIEALVRWEHPTLGLLAPDRFIPLAEQTNLIDRLTEWVVGNALADLRTLGPSAGDLVVAVNVSARNLARPGFARRIMELLDDSGIAPERLVVEITETALLTDPQRAASVLATLDNAGVKVSLDDFGRGQTSLGYLSTLPIHELKIDKSFVTDMLIDQSHAAIVRSVVDLGHNLSLRVVGEGVETPEVLGRLRAMGCDLAQGYLLARPMTVDRLSRWLLATGTATSLATR